MGVLWPLQARTPDARKPSRLRLCWPRYSGEGLGLSGVLSFDSAPVIDSAAGRLVLAMVERTFGVKVSRSFADLGGAGRPDRKGADPGRRSQRAAEVPTTSLTAKAGKVAIKFTNMAPEMHNVTIQQGTSGPTVGATPTFTGGTRTLAVNLKPGTYTFFCSVPGHRAGGMQGTITVK